MHEASLARQLLDAVLERTEEETVVTVLGWISESEPLSTESLQLHFDAAAAGTRAEGARLELVLKHVEALCSGCGERFLPDHHVRLCPSCGSDDVALTGPIGLGVDSVRVTT